MDKPDLILIGVSEVARRLGRCNATVRTMLKNRTLAGYRIGNAWKVAANDVENFLRRHRRDAA